jgi:hypothetical protein
LMTVTIFQLRHGCTKITFGNIGFGNVYSWDCLFSPRNRKARGKIYRIKEASSNIIFYIVTMKFDDDRW